MKKKRNNKGFSLVELIVVMAIMAILAVTLAPRVMQYVEKSRKTADREIINTIYTAVQYGLLDSDISNDAYTANTIDEDSDAATVDTTVDLAGLINVTAGSGGLKLTDVTNNVTSNDIYTVNGKTWNINNTNYIYRNNKLIQEIHSVVGTFKFKSNDAGANTVIAIKAPNNENITIELYYNYNTTTPANNTPDYVVSSSDVR